MKNFRKLLTLVLALTLVMACALTVSAADIKDVFDAEYYSAHNTLPDELEDDAEALYNHYLTTGIKKGLRASEKFDVFYYQALYPDLYKAFGDNLPAYVNHYVKTGLYEGRDGGGEFDAASYAHRYFDLFATYGYNLNGLYSHWLQHGKSEGRIATSQSVLDKQAGIEAAIRRSKERAQRDKTEGIRNPLLPVAPIQNGVWRNELPDGRYIETTFKNGIPTKQKEFSAGGILEIESFFDKNGYEEKRIHYNAETGKIGIISFLNKNGFVYRWEYYDENGNLTHYNLSTENHSRSGTSETIDKQYDKNGNLLGYILITNNNYRSGISESIRKDYDSSDRITGHYTDTHYPDGTYIHTEYYTDTGYVSREVVRSDGQIKSDIKYTNTPESTVYEEFYYDESGNPIPKP